MTDVDGTRLALAHTKRERHLARTMQSRRNCGTAQKEMLNSNLKTKVGRRKFENAGKRLCRTYFRGYGRLRFVFPVLESCLVLPRLLVIHQSLGKGFTSASVWSFQRLTARSAPGFCGSAIMTSGLTPRSSSPGRKTSPSNTSFKSPSWSISVPKTLGTEISFIVSTQVESRMEHPAFAKQSSLVDETGIEPATSSLRTMGKIS